jgi:tRNA A-37 threonylcarbamoyl transferase component Bud32
MGSSSSKVHPGGFSKYKNRTIKSKYKVHPGFEVDANVVPIKPSSSRKVYPFDALSSATSAMSSDNDGESNDVFSQRGDEDDDDIEIERECILQSCVRDKRESSTSYCKKSVCTESIKNITLKESADQALRNFQRDFSLAHMHCAMDASDEEEIYKFLGTIDVPKKKKNVCILLSQLMKLTDIQYQVQAIYGKGAYGMVLSVFNYNRDIFVVKLMIIAENNPKVLTNSEFRRSVIVQRQLERISKEHFKVPKLMETMKVILNNGNTVSVQVMEAVDGDTARKKLHDAIRDQKSEKIHKILKYIAAALRELHNAGYVHGDTHLDNMILTHDALYFIDFDFSSRCDERSVDVLKIIASITEEANLSRVKFEPLIKSFFNYYYSLEVESGEMDWDTFKEDNYDGYKGLEFEIFGAYQSAEAWYREDVLKKM